MKLFYFLPFLLILAACNNTQQEMYRELSDSVVMLTRETGGGTGFSVLAPSGKQYIITNWHVVRGSNAMIANESNGKRTLLNIIKSDFNHDIAALEGIPIRTIPFSRMPPRRFDILHVVGHPLLDPATPVTGLAVSESPTLVGMEPNADGSCPESSQALSSIFFTFCVMEYNLVRTTLPTFPGNSGSPVINDIGQLVGIINSGHSQTNKGLYVPLRYIQSLLKDL